MSDQDMMPNAQTPPPDKTILLEAEQWYDFPKKAMMERLAKANIANHTGDLDWNAGSEPLGSHFTPIDCFGDGKFGFCDNFVLMCVVPDYQVAIPDADPSVPKDARSQQYAHLGLRCKIIREIMDTHGIGYTSVGPARLFDTTKVPASQPNQADAVRLPSKIDATTVPMLDPAKKVNSWFKQLIIIHTPDSDMQAVINLIRSGEFAKWGLYLNDFDVTIDLRGSFNKEELIKHMLKQHGWGMAKAHSKGYFQNKTILDNSHKVGKNCLTWMVSVRVGGVDFNVRLKFYLKLVQEFEKQKVRSECGQHLADWIEMTDTRLAHARDLSEDSGLARCEATIYVNDKTKPIDTAHLALPAQGANVENVCLGALRHAPPQLLKRTPHHVMIRNWAANIKHTIVVADALYNCALVVYAKNEVTDTISGTHVTNWARRSRYILQRLMMAEHPVDLVIINRSVPYTPKEITIPDITSKTKRRKMARSSVHHFVDIDADGINQRMLEEVGITGADGGDADSDADSDDEPEMVAVDTGADGDGADGADEMDAADGDDAISGTTCMTDFLDAIPGQIDVPEDGIAFTTKRYHRFSNGGTALLTEVPRQGGLSHYFNPENSEIERIHGPFEAEAKQQAVDDVLERMCTVSGFRPLDDLNGLYVQPRSSKFKVSNKNKDITLRPCETALEPDLTSIMPATKHCAYGFSRKRRDAHKAAVMQERLRVRLVNVAQGAAERAALAQLQTSMLAANELKAMLLQLYNGAKPASIRQMNGEFEIAAIQRNVKSKSHVLFLRNQEMTLAPYASLKPIDDAINSHIATVEAALTLISPDATGRAFLVNNDFTTNTICTLALGEPMPDGHGRKVPRINLTIARSELLIPIDVMASKFAAAMEVETVEESDSIATLEVTDQVKRDAVYFQSEITVKKGETPAIFRIDSTALTSYKGHNNKLLLNLIRIDIESTPISEPKVYWGGPTLNAKASDVHVGGHIVIYETKAKDYKLDVGVLASGPCGWTTHLPRSYDSLPAIKLGMEAPLAITVSKYGTHRGNENPVVMDTSGKTWRFAAPQNVKPNPAKNQPGIVHLLVPGAVIKTAKPKLVVSIPDSGTSGA